jgi:hypothetical protein
MPGCQTAKSTLESPLKLTAGQIAAAFGIYRQAVNTWLRGFPPNGVTIKSGNECPTWTLAALPGRLVANLKALAAKRGYASVEEMFRCWFKAWRPPCPLSEITDECLEEAAKLKKALLPSLRKPWAASPGEFAREGIDDYEKEFGRRICAKHFHRLIARTVERDGALEDWERLALYLTQKPARKTKASTATIEFPFLAQAINESRPADEIWKKAFEIVADLVKRGEPRKRAARRVRNFLWQRASHLAPSRAALLVTFQRLLERHERGEPFDKRDKNAGREGELCQAIKGIPWFVPAARFFYLLSNRTEITGSTPEAVKRTISLPNLPFGWPEALKAKLLKKLALQEMPTCPPALREMILERERKYQALVPRTIARQIAVNPSEVKYFRSPREWELANLSAPGSQRRYRDRATGERVIMMPGDWFGGDDSTPGIAVCVPCNEVITPCSEKCGVLVGRFQWLVYHDCRTDKILAWDYVVRPRGSYRAEDILNGMGAAVRTHGIPNLGWQFEGGTWNSKLVCQAIDLLGCQHWRTYNPHAKAIESVFNRVWTRLAVQFPHADMGRRRMENEANCKLYEACKKAHKDPRRYFPPLETLLGAFREEVAAHNAKPINSRQYGRWTPDPFFASAIAEKPLREFSSADEWIFYPWSVERKVHGMLVSCRVPMFEDFSIPFEFGADWLPLYDGKRVRIHFNPREPRCVAKIVLLENAGEHKAGAVLGDARQINETAGHIRFLLERGNDDQGAGYLQRQRVANFMRRETRGIGTGGRVEYSKSEERGGISGVRSVERVAPAADAKEQSAQRLAASFVDGETARAERRAEMVRLEKETEHLFT